MPLAVRQTFKEFPTGVEIQRHLLEQLAKSHLKAATLIIEVTPTLREVGRVVAKACILSIQSVSMA